MKGTRSCWGGRAHIRQVLYMAAITAVRFNTIIRRSYIALRARGKKPKVAIVACMRKLLTILTAMVRDGRRWSPDLSPTLSMLPHGEGEGTLPCEPA